MLTNQQMRTQLRWEYGPNYRDILHMSAVMCHMLDKLLDDVCDACDDYSNYNYRVYTTDYKRGQEYRDVDICLYDYNVSVQKPIFSTGMMPEAHAYLTMIGKLQTLREEAEKRQAHCKAFEKRLSVRGTYAEKMRRRFL